MMKRRSKRVKGNAVRHKRTALKKNIKLKRVKRKPLFDNGYDSGYNNGYNEGYNDALLQSNNNANGGLHLNIGYSEGYSSGYKQGSYEGGEGIVDELMPHEVILPHFSVRHIIAEGLNHFTPHYYPLLLSNNVRDAIVQALEYKTPLSVVRCGDGELLTLAQDLVLSTDEVKSQGGFLHYAGVAIPDLAARDELAQSIRKASIVGVPKLRIPNYLPLMQPVFAAHGIDYTHLQLTFSTINYMLYSDGLLASILRGRRILIIGNTARELAAVFGSLGLEIEESIGEVHGVNDVPRVMAEAATCTYDIALVSAGIAAVIIAEKLASEHGKVALDFGHLSNSFIKGEAPWIE